MTHKRFQVQLINFKLHLWIENCWIWRWTVLRGPGQIADRNHWCPCFHVAAAYDLPVVNHPLAPLVEPGKANLLLRKDPHLSLSEKSVKKGGISNNRWRHVSGQITIIPKAKCFRPLWGTFPSLNPFWGDQPTISKGNEIIFQASIFSKYVGFQGERNPSNHVMPLSWKIPWYQTRKQENLRRYPSQNSWVWPPKIRCPRPFELGNCTEKKTKRNTSTFTQTGQFTWWSWLVFYVEVSGCGQIAGSKCVWFKIQVLEIPLGVVLKIDDSNGFNGWFGQTPRTM